MDFTLYNEFRNTRLQKLLNWLAPKLCITCNTPLVDTTLPCCSECYPKLPFQRDTCTYCGQRFTGPIDYCGTCITQPPPFDRCFCPFEYAPPIDEQIIKLKYRQNPHIARDIAAMLATEIRDANIDLPELLIPAPLHRKRLFQRGYNQSALLAKHLSKEFNIPVEYHSLSKHKATANQAELPLKARQSNLKNAFSIKRSIMASHVAIIDDVITTGSTASEIAKILKRKGVDYVQVWGVAHTL